MKFVLLLVFLLAWSCEAQLSLSSCNNSALNTNPDRYCSILMQRSRTQSITINNAGFSPSNGGWTMEFKMGFPTLPSGDNGNSPQSELVNFATWASGCSLSSGFHIEVSASPALSTALYTYASGVKSYSVGQTQPQGMHSSAYSWSKGYYYQSVNGASATSSLSTTTYTTGAGFASIGGLSPQCTGGYGYYETLDANFTEFRLWNSYVGQQSNWPNLINTSSIPSGLVLLYQADKTCGLNLIDLTGNKRYGTLVRYNSSDLYPDCTGHGTCDTGTGIPLCVCSSSSYSGYACEHTALSCIPQSCSGTCSNGICVGPPTVPTTVTTSSITGSSFVITWGPPAASSSPVTAFTIQCYNSSLGTITEYSGLPATYTHTVTGLAPLTTYKVYLTATNSYGTGAVATVTITTLATVPSAPMMYTVATITQTSMTVSWNAPTSNGGSPISGYFLQMSPPSSTPFCSSFSTIYSGPSLSYTVTGMTPLTYYCFVVYAANQIGYSATSSSVYFETSAAPPNPPSAPSYSYITSSSVVVSWTTPASQASITSFSLYRDGSIVYTGSANAYTDSGLVHGNTYTYYLTATSSAGTSSAGSTSSVQLLYDPPSACTYSTTVATSNTISVSWNTPSDDGGIAILQYELFFSADGFTWEVVYNGSALSYTQTGLYRNEEYWFYVVAINEAGLSSTSPPESVWTLPTVPETPVESSSSLTSNSVVITSTVFDNGGDAVTSYTVYASTDGITYTQIYSGSSSSFCVTGLTHATTYYFYAIATNVNGDSPQSSTLSITTLATIPSAPFSPTTISMTSVTYSSIGLTWFVADDGGSPITSFSLYQSIDQVNWVLIYSGSNEEYVVTGLTANTTYYYNVSATNAIGTSAFSNDSSITTYLYCMAGTYSSAVNTCTKCQLGTYSNAGSSYCTSCPWGTAPNGTGAASCLTCQPGTYGPGGVSICTKCPTGKYSNSTGAAYCVPCPVGTYTNTTGMTSCVACPPGNFANSGATNCTACHAGYYTSSYQTEACPPCPSGTYTNSLGTTVCSACAPGFYSTPGSTSCLPCHVGYYSTSQSTVCQPCPAGTWSNSNGTSTCTPCAAGYYSAAGSTSCTACKMGTYSTPNSPYCQSCPAGTYSAQNATTVCTNCNPGSFSNAGSTSCTACRPGSYTSNYQSPFCPVCPSGTYSGNSGATYCSICTPGSFANAGATSCTSCHIGYFNPYYQMGYCLPCLSGTYANETGATACTPCSTGTYENLLGATSCTSCSPGTSGPQGSNSNLNCM